ncbi:MAG: hypothetical protein HY904_18690 [Deltaproteobacteria bacterium]|nr:hypothetical protein [Deltaproteobacteria bacterium]
MRAPTFALLVLLLSGAAGDGSGCGTAGEAAGTGDQGGAREADPCRALVTKTCGDGVTTACTGPACDSARLNAAHRRERCAALAADDLQYPACAAYPMQMDGDGGVAAPSVVPPSCTALVSKVCGTAGDGGCAEAPVCADAVDIRDSRVAESCRQALDDDTSFPRCP